jgi:hypothetical protein
LTSKGAIALDFSGAQTYLLYLVVRSRTNGERALMCRVASPPGCPARVRKSNPELATADVCAWQA